MYLCPKCGNPNDDSAAFCPCCGNASGHISACNPEDTTFLYCSPESKDGPEPVISTPEHAGDSSDAADGSEQVSAGPDLSEPAGALSGFKKPVSDPCGVEPEPVTAADSIPAQPIWVTRSIDQPISGTLDESFLDDPSISTPAGENSYAKNDRPSYISDISSSSRADVDVDIFDEVFESASLIYSNIPSKIKKFIIISIVTTLLSIIPVIYVACSQQKDPGISKDIQTSLTEDWVDSWNAAAGT